MRLLVLIIIIIITMMMMMMLLMILSLRNFALNPRDSKAGIKIAGDSEIITFGRC